MPKKSILLTALVLVAAAAVLFVLVRHRGVGSAVSGGQTATIPAVAGAPGTPPPGTARPALPPIAIGTPFSASPYAAHAYLISMTDSLDAATQQALTGFRIDRRKLADGSFTVQIVSLGISAPPQMFTVAPGDKLYFVENSLMDDSSGTDRFLMDDFGVLVNASGTILQ
jgi:hypothetical protein